MSKSIIKYLCLVLSLILLLCLTACQHEKSELAETKIGTIDDKKQKSDIGEVDLVATSEPPEEPVVEFSNEWSEKIPWADLDGDGTEEYILLESGDFLNQNINIGRITMYVNNKPIYRYTNESRIFSVGDMKYLDLNGDGQEEIFVSFYPAVNSMPLAEWFVLKKADNDWEVLEIYHYEDDMLSNAFPITVALDKKDFNLSIRCEGWEGEIAFDATEHYKLRKKELEYGNNAYEVFMNGQYKEGDVVGNPLPWGVWEIGCGTYNGENCLIAEHGLGGPYGKYDYYGNADVYFNYDEDGKIRILDMVFIPAGY